MPDDPFKHVVVLMMENRSFDQMLGDLTQIYPSLEGIDPAKPNSNKYNGRTFKQKPAATTITSPDPMHDTPDVLAQIDVAGKNDNGRFVQNYAERYPQTDPSHWQQVMNYFPLGSLYATHFLARNFTICDHWFSSVPGPTWANRFFVHSGTSQGWVKMPDLHRYDQITIYDRLNDKKIPWRVYAGDVPQSLLLSRMRKGYNVKNYSRYANLAHDVHYASSFPQYVFIEPAYGTSHNDDHPPHNVMLGEGLIAEVYNTLRANDELWASTLFVLLFDEHGGFYDHVVPDTATPPDAYTQEYSFDRYGIRVPAILISDYLDPQPITDGPFDHTSLLKYLTLKWDLGPLGARTAAAKSFSDSWKLLRDRRTTPSSIAIPSIVPATGFAPTVVELTNHERGMLALSEALEPAIDHSDETKVARAALATESPQAAIAATGQRISAFIAQQKDAAPSDLDAAKAPEPERVA